VGVTMTLGESEFSGGASTLDALTASIGPVPRVLLRETDSGAEPPSKAGNEAMPTPADHAGRLQLLGEIARGGMGAVLRGRDTDLGRELAIKVLLDRHLGDPDLVRRFVEEAQIAGQLQPRNCRPWRRTASHRRPGTGHATPVSSRGERVRISPAFRSGCGEPTWRGSRSRRGAD
jgi:hypothetical protein